MAVVFFTHRDLSPLLTREFNRLKRSKKSIKVLDVGCGDGVMLFDLKKAGLVSKKIKYIGIDKDRLNTVKAQKLNPGYEFMKADALHLPFKKSSFDFVYSWMVIEHVKDTKKFVSEISRVMKKNAVCYVSSILKKRWAFYFYKRNNEFVLDPTHINEFKSEKMFKNLFKEQAFKIVSFRIIPRKYSLTELLLKIMIRLRMVKDTAKIKKIFWTNNVLGKLQHVLRMPAPGFYQIEIVCKK